MKFLSRIENIVDNKELEIHFISNKLYVANYTEILDFNNKKISLKHNKGTLYVNGNNLVISKLIDEELMINGDIQNIELR